MEEAIGKVKMALGVVACCSVILIVPSCGLLDLEKKVKLKCFYKLQTSVRYVMVPGF